MGTYFSTAACRFAKSVLNIKEFLLLLVLTGCAEHELSQSCEAPFDPIEERIYWLEKRHTPIMTPSPLLLSGIYQQTLSARELAKMSRDRANILNAWRIPYPRCGPTHDDPVPMASDHPLIQLLLRQSGAGSGQDYLRSSECWRKKFSKVNELFVSSSASLFCDPVDPELVLDTNERAREDSAPIELVEAPTEQDRIMENFFKLLTAKSDAFYRYEYITLPLVYLSQRTLEEHIERLPRKDRVAVERYSLRVVYDTNILFVRVSSEEKLVLISAPVFRAAYSLALQMVERDIAPLRSLYESNKSDPVRRAAFHETAFRKISILSKDIDDRFSQLIAFIISHELAHIYKYDANDEHLADCYGIANMVQMSDKRQGLTIFGLVAEDYAGATGGAWNLKNDDEIHKKELLERKANLAVWLDLKEKHGDDYMRELCRKRFHK